MDVTGEYLIAADREGVWAALNDPEVLRMCIHGCESMERTDDGEFHGIVATSVGPLRMKLDLVLHLENVDAPRSYTLVGETRAGSVGFGRGSADVTLAEDGASTLLAYRAGFTPAGKLARIGSRLMAGVTRKTADDFFGRLSAALASGDAGIAAGRERPGQT